MSYSVSNARLSELIGAIYDCALDPSLWEATLERIRAEFDFVLAGMGVSKLPSGEPLLAVSSGIDEYYRLRLPEYGLEIIDAWGGFEKASRHPKDEPAVHSRDGDPAAWDKNRYMLEWVKPQGIVDSVAIVVARDAHTLGTLTFSRHQSSRPIGDREIDAMRLLVPHFQRAVAISRVLDIKSLVASSFEAALDTLTSAVLLVDSDLSIVHANEAARDLLAERDPLLSNGGVLSLRDANAAAALALAVRRAELEEARFGRSGLGIPARRLDGSPSVLHVLPMRHGEVRGGLRPNATAAIFVAPAVHPLPPSEDVIAVLFDLTPAEARVLSRLTGGATVAQTAAALGIAESTVKTHLLRLFAKTGTRRQIELVKLAASLGVPAYAN